MINNLRRFFAKKDNNKKPVKKHKVLKHTLNPSDYTSFQSPRRTGGAPFQLEAIMIDKLEFGSGVKQVMRCEVEAVLRQKNPCNINDCALALEESKTLADAVDLDASMDALDGSEVCQDGKAVFIVLRQLQTEGTSFEDCVRKWEDAEKVLADAKIFFREETHEKTETKSFSTFKMQIENTVTNLMHKFKRRAFGQANRHNTALQEGAHFESAGEDLKKMEAGEEAEYQAQLDASNERQKPAAVREAEELARAELRAEEARQIATQLLRPLTEEEQSTVNDAIYGHGSPSDLLAQVDNDTVLRESMHRLQPGQWLNDEVIHYFLIMLGKRDEELCSLEPGRKRCHIFKSFFMTKLLNEGHATNDGQYEYRNVKRWSKKVAGKDLFKLDKVIFPINQGNAHWICAVAFMQEKRIQMYDSMGGGGRIYLESIFQYLQDEHQDKKKEPMPDLDAWQLIGTQGDTPRQRNGYDCGVFTCMFADFLSKDCPLVFAQEHITQCRERIALSIMNGTALM